MRVIVNHSTRENTPPPQIEVGESFVCHLTSKVRISMRKGRLSKKSVDIVEKQIMRRKIVGRKPESA